MKSDTSVEIASIPDAFPLSWPDSAGIGRQLASGYQQLLLESRGVLPLRISKLYSAKYCCRRSPAWPGAGMLFQMTVEFRTRAEIRRVRIQPQPSFDCQLQKPATFRSLLSLPDRVIQCSIAGSSDIISAIVLWFAFTVCVRTRAENASTCCRAASQPLFNRVSMRRARGRRKPR
jgi:hypothetical protein